MSNNSYKIRAFFPTVILDENRVVDPANLEYIYQYYLLENLAINFVKDEKTYVFGYAPSLAKSWEQTGKEVRFNIDTNLKWSDGSPITLDQIKRSVLNSIAQKSRHLVLLNNVLEILINKTNNEIIFKFYYEPDLEGLLHELSLADSSILSDENINGNWSVTSGPYFIEHFNKSENLIKLDKNLHFKSNINYPDIVEAIFVNGKEELSKLKSKYKLDIVYLGGHSFKQAYSNMKSDYSIVKKGHSNSIHMLKINPNSSLGKSLRSREELSNIISLNRKKLLLHETVTEETQLVPEGYFGRLDDVEPSNIEVNELKSIVGVLEFDDVFKDLLGFKEVFEEKFKEYGIKLQIKYSSEILPEEKTSVVANIVSFKGNMKDPIGSFSFLLEEFGENLQEYKEKLKEITESSVGHDRSVKLEQFHKELLRSYFLIPMIKTPTMVLLDERIDISNWNLFDMRLRFYEVSLK